MECRGGGGGTTHGSLGVCDFTTPVSCVCISLLLVIIPISGLGNMPLLAENINLATFILCQEFQLFKQWFRVVILIWN